MIILVMRGATPLLFDIVETNMKAKPQTKRIEDTRSEMEKLISAIEHANHWRCMWQLKAFGDRKLVELMWWPAASSNLVIIKDFDAPIRTGKSWPKMIAVEVFGLVDYKSGKNDWDSLQAALKDLCPEYVKVDSYKAEVA